MPVSQLDDVFELGADVLGTTQNAQGTILAQTGDVVGEVVHSDNAEVWGPLGLASRPAKAIAGTSACQAIAITQGTNDVIIAFRDTRGSGIYGTLREGETCLYAPGPNNTGTGKITMQDDGSSSTSSSITITAGGQTVTIAGGHVAHGTGATEGVVCGGAAFQAWVAAITGAITALLTAVATKAAVVGQPIDPSVASHSSGLTFPSAEISTVVKAAT